MRKRPYKSGQRKVLTIWRVELLAILRTPPHWVDVWAVVLTPVVIGVVPLVEVNKEMVANHVRYRSNADQVRILTIHSFKLHANFKSMRCWLNLGKYG